MSEQTSLAGRLKQQLQSIENEMMDLLDASTVKESINDPDSAVVFVGWPRYYWGEADARQKRLQMSLKELYSKWFESFRLLLRYAPEETQTKIQETNEFIVGWIEKKHIWGVPATIEEAKKIFPQEIRLFHELIEMIDDPVF